MLGVEALSLLGTCLPSPCFFCFGGGSARREAQLLFPRLWIEAAGLSEEALLGTAGILGL